MSGRRWVLGAGEYLVGRASRYLPRRIREQRHQEWSAELPVILDDPAIRPAARRAARMLWFAADTFRGAAVARFEPRGRHVNHDAPRKPMDPEIREGLPFVLAAPVLLALWVVQLATGWSGPSLVHDVAFLLGWVVVLLVTLVARQRFSVRARWLMLIMTVAGTGQLLHDLAPRLGWGHPLLFAVIQYCYLTIIAVEVGIVVAVCAKAGYGRYRRART